MIFIPSIKCSIAYYCIIRYYNAFNISTITKSRFSYFFNTIRYVYYLQWCSIRKCSYLNISYDLIVNEKVVSSRSDEYRYEVRKFGCSKGYTEIALPNLNLNYPSVLIWGLRNTIYITFNIEEYGYSTIENKLKFKLNNEYLLSKNSYAPGFGGPNEFYVLELENKNGYSINTIENDILNILNNIIIEDQFNDEFKTNIIDENYKSKDNGGLKSISKIEVIKL